MKKRNETLDEIIRMIKADDEHQNRMQQGSCAENLGEF